MSNHEVEILLVEDTETDAELTIKALRKRGLANRLTWVKDGVEALDFLFGPAPSEAPMPRVILLDLHLPRVSGLEVLGRIKGDERTRSIPVVVLTSSNEPSDLAACYRLGVNSYIPKPVEFHEFTRVVGELGLYWLVVNKVSTS